MKSLEDEDADRLRDEISGYLNWEYEPDGNGVSINLTGMVDTALIMEIAQQGE